MVRALSIVALLLCLAPSVAAQSPDAGKEDFQRATRYFKAGEYEAALPYYRRAYELSGHRPSTITALAQCERALGMYDEAIEHYEELLSTNPADKSRIEETIQLLRDLKKDKEFTEPTAPPPAAVPPPPKAEPAPPPPPPPPSSQPAPAAIVETTAIDEPEGDGGLLSNPVFWVAAGAAVVATVVIVAVASGSDAEIDGGTTGVVLFR